MSEAEVVDTPKKSRKKRKPKEHVAQAETTAEVFESVPSDPEITKLVTTLEVLGFKLTAEQVSSWNPEVVNEIRYLANSMVEHRPTDNWDDVVVPDWLLAWDNPTEEEKAEVFRDGQVWRQYNPQANPSTDCPWHPKTRLSESWINGTNTPIEENPPKSETPKKESEQAAVVPVEPLANDEVARLQEEINKLRSRSRRGHQVSDREYNALEVAREIARLSPIVTDAEDSYVDAKNEADEKKKTWQGLLKRLSEISVQMTAILNGEEYQPRLFEDPEDTEDSRPVKAQKSPAKKPEPAPPPPPVDVGGELDLICFTRKNLVSHCGSECPAEGLTDSKIDALKEAIGGSTVAHLEKFQRETFNWPQAIKGFGEKWIDRLQDAHLAIRTAHNIPAEESQEAVSQGPAAGAEVDGGPTAETPTDVEQGSTPDTEVPQTEAAGDDVVDDAATPTEVSQQDAASEGVAGTVFDAAVEG